MWWRGVLLARSGAKLHSWGLLRKVLIEIRPDLAQGTADGGARRDSGEYCRGGRGTGSCRPCRTAVMQSDPYCFGAITVLGDRRGWICLRVSHSLPHVHARAWVAR